MEQEGEDMAKMIDGFVLKTKLMGIKAFYTSIKIGAAERSESLKLMLSLLDSIIDEIDSMAGESDDRT